MSQTITRERANMENPFRPNFDDGGAGQAPMLAPRQPGPALDEAMAAIVTAQKVAVKRDMGAIMRTVQTIAAAAGQKFYYSWSVNDRANNRQSLVEGLGIKGAMAVATAYGNCRVDAVIAQETQSHVTFAARFMDYETGFTLTRLFQQRKSQNTGMKDKDRAADLVFQIGQSKAIRNVIIQALPILCEEAKDSAKSALLDRIALNPEAARAAILSRLDDLGVDTNRVERVVGRIVAKWSAQHMARIWAELTAIQDGLADADDLYPIAGNDDEAAAKPPPASTTDDASRGRRVVDVPPEEPVAARDGAVADPGRQEAQHDEAEKPPRRATAPKRAEPPPADEPAAPATDDAFNFGA
ncbi:MAG: hypothetical protein ACK5VI_09470 [Opitutia bacterium]